MSDLLTRLQATLREALAEHDHVTATAIRGVLGELSDDEFDTPDDVRIGRILDAEIVHLRAAAQRLAAAGSPSAVDARRQAEVLGSVRTQ